MVIYYWDCLSINRLCSFHTLHYLGIVTPKVPLYIDPKIRFGEFSCQTVGRSSSKFGCLRHILMQRTQGSDPPTRCTQIYVNNRVSMAIYNPKVKMYRLTPHKTGLKAVSKQITVQAVITALHNAVHPTQFTT